MTLLRSILFLAFFSLTSCSTLHAILWDEETQPEQPSTEQKIASQQKKISNQFAWAVQNYEAGRYEKALPLFQKLKKEGPQLENFELLSFYLGMCHFRLEEFEPAQVDLEYFVQQRLDLHQMQEAKLALLSIYEARGDWSKILGLAAEMNSLSLFQDSRAYLKISWARALRETKEYRSARLMLKEGRDFLDPSDFSQLRPTSPDQDLWGKYHAIELLLQLDECELLTPKQVGKDTRLEAWLDASADCLRGSLRHLSENLISTDSPWTAFGESQFDSRLQSFFDRYKNWEKPLPLPRKRKVNALAKSAMYRLYGELEKQAERLKGSSLSLDPLDRLKKHIDSLLLSLSLPSS